MGLWALVNVNSTSQEQPAVIGSRLEHFFLKAAVVDVHQSLSSAHDTLFTLGPVRSVAQRDFLQPLAAYTNSPAGVPAGEEALVPMRAGLFFFRLLHQNPERIVLPEAGTKIKPRRDGWRDCCYIVAPLRILHVDPAGPTVRVCLDDIAGTAATPLILDLSLLTSKELQSMRSWKLVPEANSHKKKPSSPELSASSALACRALFLEGVVVLECIESRVL